MAFSSKKKRKKNIFANLWIIRNTRGVKKCEERTFGLYCTLHLTIIKDSFKLFLFFFSCEILHTLYLPKYSTSFQSIWVFFSGELFRASFSLLM